MSRAAITETQRKPAVVQSGGFSAVASQRLSSAGLSECVGGWFGFLKVTVHEASSSICLHAEMNSGRGLGGGAGWLASARAVDPV